MVFFWIIRVISAVIDFSLATFPFLREGLQWSSFWGFGFLAETTKKRERKTRPLGHAQIILKQKGIQLKLNPFFYVLK